MIEITHLNNTNSTFGFFSSLFLIILLCSSIRLTQLILLQRRFFGPRYIGDDFYLGAKQEGLMIVHFLNKLIVDIHVQPKHFLQYHQIIQRDTLEVCRGYILLL